MKKKTMDVSELALNLKQLTHTDYDREESRSGEFQSPEGMESQLKNTILDLAGIPEAQFSWSQSLRVEIGLDSLDMVELVMICEKDFGVSISDREWQGLSTAASLRDLISAHRANT
ncbi:MAG: acyl carrier protein [Bacteroidia bacterium]|nr:acyl carrier protein [Bacteroidia bacterium]